MHPAYVEYDVPTQLYAGLVDDPERGLIHVTGYYNEVRNTHRGANCMIIHIPAGEPMDMDNFIDPEKTSGILGAMSYAVFPPEPVAFEDMSHILVGASATRSVQYFKVGEYEVLLAENPEEIPAALSRVSTEKRPTINEEIFTWYKENAPGWTVALFCFNADRVRPRPIFWWYKPLEGMEDMLRPPAIDSHDGHAPELGKLVGVNTEIFLSWPGIDGIDWPRNQSFYGSVSHLIPRKVAGVKFQHELLPNGDFGIPVNTPVVNGLVSKEDVRRLSLPGSKVRS